MLKICLEDRLLYSVKSKGCAGTFTSVIQCLQTLKTDKSSVVDITVAMLHEFDKWLDTYDLFKGRIKDTSSNS